MPEPPDHLILQGGLHPVHGWRVEERGNRSMRPLVCRTQMQKSSLPFALRRIPQLPELQRRQSVDAGQRLHVAQRFDLLRLRRSDAEAQPAERERPLVFSRASSLRLFFCAWRLGGLPFLGSHHFDLRFS